MIDIAQLIGEDLYALFTRALLNQSIAAFGADGCGKYGTHPFAQYFKIEAITIDAYMDEDDHVDAFVNLHLENYSASQLQMCTDKNAILSVQNLLSAAMIDRTSISWAPISRQQEKCICFSIDLKKLNL